jgi:TonB family protein
MFDTLPESRRTRGHPGVASLTSLSAHALAVTWAAAAWTGAPDAWRPFDDAERVSGYASLRFLVHTAPAVASGRRAARPARPSPRAVVGARPAGLAAAPVVADLAMIAEPVLREIDGLETGALSGPGPRIEDFSSSPGRHVLPGAAVSVGGFGPADLGPRLADFPAFPAADNPVPRYPEALLVAQVEGQVRVRFVIDTTGALDPRSVRIVASTNEQFTRAVKAVLPRLHFLPAVSDGKRVRVPAEQAFAFVLAR